MRKRLNLALAISFALTVMVPLTGIHLHKLSSVFFLILCLVHTFLYRKKLGAKRWGLLAMVMLSFVTGLFGMILDEYFVILILHRAISIGLVFFLAIHIFVFHKRMK